MMTEYPMGEDFMQSIPRNHCPASNDEGVFAMKISRRAFLSSGTIGFGSLLMNPIKAFAWSAFTGNLLTSNLGDLNTHQFILIRALRMLKEDPAMKITGFPDNKDVLECDWVRFNLVDKMYGTGPDVEGTSPYSWHYYNPKTKTGRGPYAVKKHFMELVQGLRVNSSGPASAKAAAWTGHFIADMHVPYHVVGMPAEEAFERLGRGRVILMDLESGPLELYRLWAPPVGWGGQQNFENALRYFCENNPLPEKAKKATRDWFDPWYFNGISIDQGFLDRYKPTMPQVFLGSHATWEIDVTQNLAGFNEFYERFVTKQGYYDQLWQNEKIRLGQDFWIAPAKRAEVFAGECALRTRDSIMSYWKHYKIGVCFAIRAVFTLLRASMTTIRLTSEVCRLEGDKVRVDIYIVNESEKDALEDVEVRLSLKGPEGWRGSIEQIGGAIPPGKKAKSSWGITTKREGRLEFLAEVSGIYPRTPDLGYNSQFFSLDAKTVDESNKEDRKPGDKLDSRTCESCPTCPPKEARHHLGDTYDYWTMPNGKKVGPHREWYDRERTRKKLHYCYNEQGQLHGPYKYWVKNNQRKIENNYKNGKKDGECKNWYEENGARKSIVNFRDGKLHGSYRTWGPDGNVLLNDLYEDGKKIKQIK